MKNFKLYWLRFFSKVPAALLKLQILLGILASASIATIEVIKTQGMNEPDLILWLQRGLAAFTFAGIMLQFSTKNPDIRDETPKTI